MLTSNKENNTKMIMYLKCVQFALTLLLNQTVIEIRFFNSQYFRMIYCISKVLNFIINVFNFIGVNILL
jgi:hypothetical protein